MLYYNLEKTTDPAQAMKNLYDIVTCLRDPHDGCPWDREQMPRDIIRSMQGEIFEYIDALNQADLQHQSEELGDIFLNLFLLGKIHDQNGDFKLSDSLNEACEKYIRRHPHVFSNVQVSSTEDVLKNWNQIKKTIEGRQESGSDFFDGRPKSAPELEDCYFISKKAAKVGFDWPNASGVADKVREELSEVEEASTPDQKLEELGDLLFTVVNLCRKNHIKPQDALSFANTKFVKRFNQLYALAQKEGRALEDLTPEQWDYFWTIVKSQEH